MIFFFKSIFIFISPTRQIKEEEELKEAVKRIEAKRKDREKKAHDLQRLINNTERVSLSPDRYFLRIFLKLYNLAIFPMPNTGMIR
jgi:hypothetical protein